MLFDQEDASTHRPLIGEILVKRRLISPEQLNEALDVQKKENGFVGEILLKLGYLEERDIVVALVVQCSLPYIAINKYEIDPEVLKLVPEKTARDFHAVPLDRVGDVLSMVMVNPLSEEMKSQLEKITGCKIATFIATRSEINEAISKWYKKG